MRNLLCAAVGLLMAMGAGIRPVEAAVSDADVLALAAAAEALEQGRAESARTAAAEGGAVVSPLTEWLSLRKTAGANDPRRFLRLRDALQSLPENWPHRQTMAQEAERLLVRQPPFAITERDIIGWFQRFPATDAEALEAHARALNGTGQVDAVREVMARAWGEMAFGQAQQARLLQEFGPFLSAADHARRVDFLLDEGEPAAAQTLLDRVPPDDRALLAARLAYVADRDNAAESLAGLPTRQLQDPDLLLERVIWHRKRNQDAEASALLDQMPARPDRERRWWAERERQARRAMERGDMDGAYRLAANHRAVEGIPFGDGEFLAGWLSLRYLGAPDRALDHFERMHGGVETALSKAQAAFWAARAHQALGDSDQATRWYQDSGRYPETFYGQMALAQLGQPMRIRTAPDLSEADLARFEQRPRVQAARLLYAIGEDLHAGSFLSALREDLEGEKDLALLVRVALDLEQPYWATRAAFKVNYGPAGQSLGYLGYPAFKMPERMLADNAPPPEVLHAIMRQESAFNIGIRSPVGALGLMQLMPATARETAERLGVGHDEGRLYTDPGFNIQLGAKYLGDRLDENDRALILASAAYNAGPGNLRRWLDRLGDPNSGSVDPLDWIESLPFRETRLYVKRVTSGYNVYRALFARLDQP